MQNGIKGKFILLEKNSEIHSVFEGLCHLVERQKQRKGETVFISLLRRGLGLGQAETRSQELHLSLPCAWQESRHLEYHLLLSQVQWQGTDQKLSS